MNVGRCNLNLLIDGPAVHLGDTKMFWFAYYCTVQGTYLTCINFTTFCTQTAKKPEDLRRFSSQVGLTEHDAVSLSSAQRHRYSLSFFLSDVCVDQSSVLTPSWVLLWLWTQAQVNDNLNPSLVHFLSSCSSLALVTRTAAVCVCGFSYQNCPHNLTKPPYGDIPRLIFSLIFF